MEYSKEAFMKKVKISSETGCWEWTGTTTQTGYGICLINKKQIRAHRVSYSLFKGEIPEGLFTLHTCDNRSCVNPDHLFLGTNQDNTNDMIAKGRHRRMTDVQVEEIRNLYKTGLYSIKQLALQFLCSDIVIKHVLNSIGAYSSDKGKAGKLRSERIPLKKLSTTEKIRRIQELYATGSYTADDIERITGCSKTLIVTAIHSSPLTSWP